MASHALRTRQILVLASGATSAEKSNKKGHLFEVFVANLLHDYGYDKPVTSNLNVTSNGIELDVTGTHDLTKQRMVAECKAYSSPVASKELASFYGKLTTERLDHPDTYGYFVAVPGLTADGQEFGRKIESKDSLFRVLSSEQILTFLEQKSRTKATSQLLKEYSLADRELSDEALVISEHGLYVAVKELDPDTRLSIRVLVFSYDHRPVPNPVLEELGLATFANNVPCIEPERHVPLSTPVMVSALAPRLSTSATIVEVTGSKSDFEYQFPASPKFFVGRKAFVREAESIVAECLAGEQASPTVLVLNAQSGWGKSSFALKIIDQVRKQGGFGVCIDSRTADSPAFVCAALRNALTKAELRKTLSLPDSASFASLQSAMETLRHTTFTNVPICIFFDQFENVFQNHNTTLEFRNLTLAITEIAAPIILGFAWKTDLVSFTEGHPYQLRDDIRSRAHIISLEPLSADDVSQIITRLQKESGQTLHRDLREKLREYSQGLPWLLKKLSNHILRELRAGVLQESLVAEVLNVQNLFESDLRGLSPDERAALSAIAKNAPVLATDAVDLARSPKIVQSLLDQRLLVQIGERLDVYWDIFRDFLNRGSVPIEDGYILRLTPNGVGKLIRFLRDNYGSSPSEAAAGKLATSKISVFNMARDLRQLGVLSAIQGTLKFADEISAANDLEAAIRARSSVALKRHRAYALFLKLAKGTLRVPALTFAAELPKLYPAVIASEKTWSTYARAFAKWFQYAGLVAIDGDEILLGSETDDLQSILIVPPKRARRGVGGFPHSPVEPVLTVLEALNRGDDPSPLLKLSTLRRALADALYLDLVEHVTGPMSVELTSRGRALALSCGAERQALLADAIHRQPAYSVAAELLQKDPAIASGSLGLAVAARIGTTWSDETAKGCGKFLRGWMRASGMETTRTKTSRSSATSRGPK